MWFFKIYARHNLRFIQKQSFLVGNWFEFSLPLSFFLFLSAHGAVLFWRTPPPLFYSIRILQVSHGTESRIDDYGSCDVDPPPYLALARGALVLPGAAAIVDDAAVAARPRNRERGAVRWHLSTTGIVLATRATVALLGHGI